MDETPQPPVPEENSAILKTEVEDTPAKEEAMQVLTSQPESPVVAEAPVEQTKTTLKGLWIGAGIAAILVAIIFFWMTRSKNSVSPVVTTPTPSPVSQPFSQPSPTPAVEIPAKDAIKIQVLNGSGVKGAAGKVKDALLAKGYENVDTGNADEEQDGTTVSAISNKLSTAEMVATDLEITGVKSNDTLESTSNYDVVVILGK